MILIEFKNYLNKAIINYKLIRDYWCLQTSISMHVCDITMSQCHDNCNSMRFTNCRFLKTGLVDHICFLQTPINQQEGLNLVLIKVLVVTLALRGSRQRKILVYFLSLYFMDGKQHNGDNFGTLCIVLCIMDSGQMKLVIT